MTVVHSPSAHTQPGTAESGSSLDPRVIAAARALYDIDHSGFVPSWIVREEHPERYVWGKEAARIIAVLDALAPATTANSVGTERSEVHHETGDQP